MTEIPKEKITLKNPIFTFPWQRIKSSTIPWYWLLSGLSSLILPLGVTHGSVLYYCIKKNLPAITIMSDIDGLYEIGLVGVLFLCITVSFFLLPAFVIGNPQKYENIQDEQKNKIDTQNILYRYKGWVDLFLPSYILYLWYIGESISHTDTLTFKIIPAAIFTFYILYSFRGYYTKPDIRKFFRKLLYTFSVTILNSLTLLFTSFFTYHYITETQDFTNTPNHLKLLATILFVSIPALINFIIVITMKNYKTLSLAGVALFFFQVLIFPGITFFVEKSFRLLKVGGGQIVEIAANKKTACTYPFLFENNLKGKTLDCETPNTSEFSNLYRTKPLEVMYISRRIIIIQDEYYFENDTGEQKSSLATFEIDRSEVHTVYFIDNIDEPSKKTEAATKEAS